MPEGCERALEITESLLALVDAIDAHAERRAFLGPMPNTRRRINTIVRIHDISHEYDRARRALGIGAKSSRRPA